MLKMFWGWKFLEAESVLRPKLFRGWKCLPTVLGAESFSRLKVSLSWKFLGATSVSWLKVSRSRNCLRAEIVATESVSGLKVSFTLMAESVWRLKMSGLQISRDGNCLRAESVLETLITQKVDTNRIQITKIRTTIVAKFSELLLYNHYVFVLFCYCLCN